MNPENNEHIVEKIVERIMEETLNCKYMCINCNLDNLVLTDNNQIIYCDNIEVHANDVIKTLNENYFDRDRFVVNLSFENLFGNEIIKIVFNK